MIKAAVLLLALTGASAFSPARQPVRGKVTMSAGIPDGAFGATTEVGNKAFDPLKLAQYRDFDELRACETRNGRVAMLASVGWVWPQIFGTWAGGPVKTVDPIETLSAVPVAAWAQMILLASVFEVIDFKHKQSGSTEPVWDPLQLLPKEEKAKKAMMEKELKNGRLAMLAFAAFVSEHFIPGAVPVLPPNFV
eukprot:CAMPEP_0118973548 /NCGR_PEP_ID=MMETSP1173-20130426/10414_1 /TAXON_ID=1034831 /ORGANISM="Rhizochromulina marina cf, Strain CCMP1243" /LENGTH=192 /DNA_ID=CAMNT_0006923225 /DNA_START=26 /DNA_END=604 /DNA_ORIENTATION=+